MSFEEWKEKFVSSAPEKALEKIFQPMGDYIRPGGNFDLDTALNDYEKFLQTVPEKNRMYLQQAISGSEYKRVTNPDVVFAYSAEEDIIQFNPEHPMFSAYDFRTVMTHELGHRIDHTMFIHSWEGGGFSDAISSVRTVIDADPEKFLTFVNNSGREFLSDTFSAICEQDYKFPVGHEKDYWLKPGAKEREIFANLFSLETFGDETSLDFFRKDFPEVWDKYGDFWK